MSMVVHHTALGACCPSPTTVFMYRHVMAPDVVIATLDASKVLSFISNQICSGHLSC